MLDSRIIDDTVRRISDAMPAGARRLQEDVEKNIRSIVSSALSRLDLINRDEFEIQKGVLLRSRDMIEALERRVSELEARLIEPEKNGQQEAKPGN